MTTQPPTVDVAALLKMGKQTMEFVTMDGQFFFPKIVVCYSDGRKEPIQVSQYEGDFESLITALDWLASQGPMDWIATTNDAYMLAANVDTDDPDVQRLLRGETSVTELFEADHPAATESLQVLLVTRDSVEGGSAPYTRRGNKIVWTNPANIKGEEIEGRYVDAMRAAIEASNA